ncbi:MAG: 6-phosphogluconolactonase [Acidimicrobiaceae bacterium]|nr:6-phosphogluconolactonase [Acidimicrobiaceae bacterium]
MQLREFTSPDALAQAGATFIAECASRAVAARGEFRVALSGGQTPLRTWEHLATLDLAWERFTIFQVDERIAPEGDRDRNLSGLRQGLSPRTPRIVAMPVEDSDVEGAAARYAAQLPDHFDLVQLGLGPDGHTASLVVGDPGLDVTDRLVTVTREYQGRRRMTFTYPALARAHETLWIVSGDDTRDALGRLLAGDESISAGRVGREYATVLTDLMVH